MCELEETWAEKLFFDKPLSFSTLSQNTNSYDESNCQLLRTVDIFTASSIGDYQYVKYLLKNQISDANSLNKSHWSALMYAVYYCCEEVVYLLLENGASLHIRNGKGQNILMMAAGWGYETLSECFIKNKYSSLLLMLPRRNKSISKTCIVTHQHLTQYSKTDNMRDAGGAHGSQRVKSGSIIEARDSVDWTALFHAVYFDKLEVTQILLKNRANPNACVRYSGKTPLMYAACNGNLAMVDLLLKAGAFPNFLCMAGQDAEKLALEAGHQHVATFLNQWKNKGPSLLDGPAAIEVRDTFLHQMKTKNSVGTEPTCTIFASDLDTFLTQFGLETFIPLFREQQVNLLVFLSLTDKDLKECGVTKLGPRRKMTEAISRWHNNAPLRRGLEAAYSLKLEIEMEQLKAQFSECTHKRHRAESVVKEMKKRLEECHKRCLLVRDNLSNALRFPSVFSVSHFSDDLTIISTYLEDMYRMIDIGSGSSSFTEN